MRKKAHIKKEALHFMNRKGKIFSVLIVFIMLFGVVLAGCSSSGSTAKDTTAPVSTAKGTTAPASSIDTSKKIDMTMFMGNSGLVYPDGVDPSDNPYINIVEKYANVDLKLTVPGYADFKVKQDLMLASGQLPDIVHSWYTDDMIKAADDGAFIDLKKYYDKSPIMQKVITPDMLELTKTASGHYFRMPMAWKLSPQGSWMKTRYDLIEKYNNGTWPVTVDEWVAFMEKMHKADPTAIVMSNRVIGDNVLAYGSTPIFQLYGVPVYGYRVTGGKVMSTFVILNTAKLW